MTLKFSPANAKTVRLASVRSLQKYLANNRKVYSLDLTAGKTCPGALDCKSMVVQNSEGKWVIQDGKDTQFRCFGASIEVRSTAARRLHEFNISLISGCGHSPKRVKSLLLKSLPPDLGILRYHVSGDWFRKEYLMGAYETALAKPNILFYFYTKSLYFLDCLDCIDLSQGIILPNFLVTASRGGKYDHLIEPLNMREAVVITDLETNKVIAKRKNLTRVPKGFPYGGYPIDHDDSHAATIGGSFALLLHGVQPAESDASKVLSMLKGKSSYKRK